MEKSRIELLEEGLAGNPDNTFMRYALALELGNSGASETAWKHFEYLLQHHPKYSPTYYQAGKLLARQGRTSEARTVLVKGIEVTEKEGNAHARSELEAALAELG
jgi:Flp pilus assembly protein TadD